MELLDLLKKHSVDCSEFPTNTGQLRTDHRIVIPAKLRAMLKLESGTPVQMYRVKHPEDSKAAILIEIG